MGSPFFLQDPLPRNLISNPLYNDQSKTVKTKNRIRKPEIEHVARDERIKMTLGPVTTITSPSSYPSTSGIPKQTSSGNAAPSSEKTPSRRTGSRTRQGERAGDTSLVVPQLTIIGPTPEPSPSSATTPTRRIHHKSTPTMPPKSILPPVIEKSYSNGSVKRKADEADVELPKETKEHKATFAADPRTNRLSSHSIGHAPSSYHRSKRVRLTSTSEGGRSTMSHTSLLEGSFGPPSAKNTGSWSSRGSHGPRSASYLFSREGPPLARSASHASHPHSVQGQPAPSRRSLSQISIPISALVSPHAPSIAHSGTFHMRDPRKPAPVQSTPWTLSFPTHWQPGESKWALQTWVSRGGSPRHAWLFFLGFVIFPLWWVAALLPIPRTRRIGGTDAEKGVTLDDPQVEYDANSWRFRCRIMALLSLITYIPFIVLLAIFTRH